ncbi:MAG: DUF3427 domain-containing protein [Actinomycetota bacterium]|nr:DUF3427 domain-containing protein [Actinomycetota bacterium]
MAENRGVIEGLYESLITQELAARLSSRGDLVPDEHGVNDADQPEVFARHIRDVARRALTAERDPDRRVALANRLLAVLDDPTAEIVRPRQLLSAVRPTAPGRLPFDTRRPATPLSDSSLLTNAAGEPGIGAEVRAELSSADGVDAIIAFVKWYGLRVIEPELQLLVARGVPLRIITTTYMGATERQALDRLVRDLGAQVKIQYDAKRTRLHAKAWHFRRDTGFDTAYVGSSNLSRAALLDGVEWNVRLSSVATPAVLEKFSATFESYWADSTFESYDPERDGDRLDDALAQARQGGTGTSSQTLALSGLEVTPYPYQTEMLEQLDVERLVHERHRNLLVAATGTGKTVVAALDYRELCARAGRRLRLLFVAHRKEILTQSLRTYREVLADASFGELYVDGARPERWQHVFASVQSLSAYGMATIAPDAFEVVVIDEFHHGAATSYRAILDRLTPTELLGLTATPERGDGFDVRDLFGGHVAAELRLWDALKADLLTPFHYFGIADGTDLRRVDWSSGAYDAAALSGVYTGDDARARIILGALRDKVVDLASMKALCFCVSIDHAEFMADRFRQAGIAAATITSRTPGPDRECHIADLRGGRLQAIMTVDIFNEGVDVPAINTVLFLRPTESSTVFLQQLGRGLRLAPHKPVLTALDFVGHHRKEFRFDRRFRAMTSSTRAQLEHDVEHGFPYLPAGTQIVLDRTSQDLVLDNIRSQVTTRWAPIVTELRDHPTDDLATFLTESGIELADVVRADRSWARLRRDAGLSVPAGGPRETSLLKRVRALAHVDDPDRAAAYLALLDAHGPSYVTAPPALQAHARMLVFSLWPDGGGFTTYDAALAALRTEPATLEDLRAVLDLGVERATRVTASLTGDLHDRPLRVHARYTREEIVAALGYVSLEGRRANSVREGVMFSQEANSDAFFVTLRKSEADYSPTTMYQDYALSRDKFHWESQSGTRVASATGQRYLHHAEQGSHVLLFIRPSKVTELGGGAPYLFLGEATYESHRGERPIAITWRLTTPMPAADFEVAKVVA